MEILYLAFSLMNYSTCGIMLYAKLSIGSPQLEDTDQCLSLKRFTRLSSITTSTMLWLNDATVLARMLTAINLEFERALHYHDEGYKNNNDYGHPPCITRPVCISSMFSAEASFNPADYTVAQHQLLPFIPRGPKGLPF